MFQVRQLEGLCRGRVETEIQFICNVNEFLLSNGVFSPLAAMLRVLSARMLCGETCGAPEGDLVRGYNGDVFDRGNVLGNHLMNST